MKLSEINIKIMFNKLKEKFDEYDLHCAVQTTFDNLFNECIDDLVDNGIFYKSVDFAELVDYCKEQGYSKTSLFNCYDNKTHELKNYIIFDK